jgi:multidrug efflux pump subunit AcrB
MSSKRDRFEPGNYPMKRLLLAGLLLVLLTGGYYFLGFFFEAQNLDTYEYTLQSHNVDELSRFAPVAEAQMRRLPVLQDVGSDLQVKSPEAIGNSRLMLPGIMISFKLAPGVPLGNAIDQIQRMERGLQFPATITTSFSKRSLP